jgi:MFS family permease
MVVVVVFYAAEVNQAFFLLKGGDEGFSVTTVLMLYLLFNLTFALLPISFGRLSDSLGRRPVIAASFAIFSATCAVMAFADELWLLVAGFLMFGAYKASSEGVFKAYVVDEVPSELRGSALGAFHTCVGLVMLPGGALVGLLWDSYGSSAAFLFGSVVAAASIVLLLLMAPERRAREA